IKGLLPLSLETLPCLKRRNAAPDAHVHERPRFLKSAVLAALVVVDPNHQAPNPLRSQSSRPCRQPERPLRLGCSRYSLLNVQSCSTRRCLPSRVSHDLPVFLPSRTAE